MLYSWWEPRIPPSRKGHTSLGLCCCAIGCASLASLHKRERKKNNSNEDYMFSFETISFVYIIGLRNSSKWKRPITKLSIQFYFWTHHIKTWDPDALFFVEIPFANYAQICATITFLMITWTSHMGKINMFTWDPKWRSSLLRSMVLFFNSLKWFYFHISKD